MYVVQCACRMTGTKRNKAIVNQPTKKKTKEMKEEEVKNNKFITFNRYIYAGFF